MKHYTCPICGWPDLTERPRGANGGGSYEFCPSCYVEFGYTDDALGFSDRAWRAAWVADGMPFRGSKHHRRPDHWDPAGQLRALLETPPSEV